MGAPEITRAPWSVDVSIRGRDGRVQSPAGLVANVGNGFNVGTVGADTRLIAAAPDLYGVAEEAIAVLEDVLAEEQIEEGECATVNPDALCGSSWCQSAGCIVDKLARARAALAKARGEPLPSDTAPVAKGGE